MQPDGEVRLWRNTIWIKSQRGDSGSSYAAW
jgi:hypothetical protein